MRRVPGGPCPGGQATEAKPHTVPKHLTDVAPLLRHLDGGRQRNGDMETGTGHQQNRVPVQYISDYGIGIMGTRWRRADVATPVSCDTTNTNEVSDEVCA